MSANSMTKAVYAQSNSLAQKGVSNDAKQSTEQLQSSSQDNQVVSGDSSILSGNNLLCHTMNNNDVVNSRTNLCGIGDIINPQSQNVITFNTQSETIGCGPAGFCNNKVGDVYVSSGGSPGSLRYNVYYENSSRSDQVNFGTGSARFTLHVEYSSSIAPGTGGKSWETSVSISSTSIDDLSCHRHQIPFPPGNEIECVFLQFYPEDKNFDVNIKFETKPRVA